MALDYKTIGLRMGIEIHQQLDGKKLFCNCPTVITKDKPDFVITRRLRASAGETGEVDQAAKHEQQKSKYFVYQGYEDSTCLLELDERPPGPVNPEALKIGLQLANMLNCKIVHEIQFMRKTVIDGSNTSGFQRTALIGTDGYIDLDGKKIGIESICLEEEACQVVERKKEHDVYNLSRLGIPLIEIATAPDISTPTECKQVALKLGMVLRSIPGMKRGIGSIRQDVNMSIKGKPRIEIKGFQEVKTLPRVVDTEIERQLALKEPLESHVRKAEPDATTTFLRPMPGAARMYPETDVAPIIVDTSNIEKVELIADITEKVKKLGLSKDLAEAISKDRKAELFIGFVDKFSTIKPAFIAETMISTPKTIKRKDNITVDIYPEQFEKIFEELAGGRISKDSVYNIILDFAKTGKLHFDDYKMMSEADLKKEIDSIIKEAKGVPFNALIGRAMGKLKGKADPQKVLELLKEKS